MQSCLQVHRRLLEVQCMKKGYAFSDVFRINFSATLLYNLFQCQTCYRGMSRLTHRYIVLHS